MIFLRLHFFLEKVDDLLVVVALSTPAKSAELTMPTLQISPAQQNSPKKLTYYVQKIFLRPGGGGCTCIQCHRYAYAPVA